MGFYNPLSESADIPGGISDFLKMIWQYMMIQKMYPQGSGEPTGATTPTGYNPFSRGGIPFSLGGTTPPMSGTPSPMGGVPFSMGGAITGGLNLNPRAQQSSGELDMNYLMQLLMQLFSQRTPPGR